MQDKYTSFAALEAGGEIAGLAGRISPLRQIV